MTLQGAITELRLLLKANDMPIYYKPCIEKVIETIQMEWAYQMSRLDEIERRIEMHEKAMAKVADTPQTESTGSPIGDYRDGVGAWQTDKLTEEEFDTMLAKVLVGQTDCELAYLGNEYCEACKYGQDISKELYICNKCGVGINNYTPQTDCGWE